MTSQPEFLTLADLLDTYADQIRRYGGDSGVREMELLQSAVAMPQVGLGDQYLHGNLYEMAAAYLYHITPNHPFIDGNKRAGAVAAVVFLDLNGRELSCSNDDLEAIVLAVTRGEMNKPEVAAFLRDNCA